MDMLSNQIRNRVELILIFFLPEIVKPWGLYYLEVFNVPIMVAIYLTSIPLWSLIVRYIYELYKQDKKFNNMKNNDNT